MNLLDLQQAAEFLVGPLRREVMHKPSSLRVQRVSAEIRKLRHGLDRTQSSLALVLGAHRRTVSGWERGLHRPSERLQQRLARIKEAKHAKIR